MYELHRLLWDVRRHPGVKDRYLADPDSVLDEYGVGGEFRAWMRDLDFRSLHEHGINPYLLYFCAIQLQVDRTEYYARIRGELS
ncbi:hypothetical protein F9C11_21095 [Amycolatopsis sp. VS8301801F10]|uniref:hypothetical protein n=1 Tax=unclassified Amycolatopsis TaxID=2618356 RepID=UPI0038FD1BB1